MCRSLLALAAGALLWLLSPLALAQASADKPADDLALRWAEAARDPKVSEALFKTGRKAVAFCANCHGEGGNSSKPDVPNLAGQNGLYLLEQIRKFADGRRRNEFMEAMIRALSTDEKVGAALYLAGQKVEARPRGKPALIAQGEDLFQKNCFRCHGQDGRGSEKFARIAGQQDEYLRVSIKRYRSGSNVRGDPLMASATRLLSDEHIEALVAYIASMK